MALALYSLIEMARKNVRARRNIRDHHHPIPSFIDDKTGSKRYMTSPQSHILSSYECCTNINFKNILERSVVVFRNIFL